MKIERGLIFIGLMMLLLPELFDVQAQKPQSGAPQKAAVPQVAMAGKFEGKFALLVGIDKYHHIKSLNGAVRDVEELQKLLTSSKFGFDPKNVIVIKDEQGTAENILGTFRKHLIENAKKYKEKTGKEAIVLFHYSGHGSQVPSADPKETDGKDETLVTVNSRDKEGKNFDIIDDEIETLITDVAKYTTQATYIFDSCHSGTINRGEATGREVEMDTRPQPKRTFTKRADQGAQSRDAYKDDLLPASDKYVLIVGSQSGEKSYEKELPNRVYHGALTYYLLRELRQAKPTTTYREMMNRVAGAVSLEYQNQHPQVLGDVQRNVLGGSASEEDSYVRVTKVEGSEIHIAAGEAMGVKVGTMVAFYSAATRRLSGEEGKLLETEITRVMPTEAVATFKPRPGLKIATDSKAVLVSPLFGAEPLKVVLERAGVLRGADSRAEIITVLADRLKDSKLLTALDIPATDRERGNAAARPANAVYVKRGKFAEVFPMDKPEPSKAEDGKTTLPLPKNEDEVFYITSSDGQPLYDFYVRADSEKAAGKIAEALEKMAKQNNLKALESRTSPVNDSLEVRIVKVTVRQTQSGIEPVKEEELPLPKLQNEDVFPVGVYFKLKIKNVGTKDLYITALNLSSDGAINVMYPRPDYGIGQEILKPNGSLQTALFITSRPYGQEAFKIIATHQPSDFSPLAQDKIKRGDRNFEHPLNQLMERALTGTRGVNSVPIGYTSNNWGTAQLTFTIVRPER